MLITTTDKQILLDMKSFNIQKQTNGGETYPAISYKYSEKKVPLGSSDVSMSHIISQMLVSHTLIKTVMLN